ncbi:DUF4258 domain-containing protein [bacterium]|nr:DUF4258 domain-containing protein [bacterium]
MNIEFVQRCIDSKDFYITYHAFLMINEREVERSEMLNALYKGEVIERNPKSKPYPSFLVLGWLRTGDPLHVKCSHSTIGKRLRIVTVYEPSDEKWEKDYKTRKKKR